MHCRGCPRSQQMYPRLHPALPNQLQLSLLTLASGFSAVLFCSCDRKGFLSLMQGPFDLFLCSLFRKVQGRRFQFFYKAVKSSLSGKNISSLPAVCYSLVQCSSNLFALGQYHCRMGTIHGADETCTWHGKLYSTFPAPL